MPSRQSTISGTATSGRLRTGILSLLALALLTTPTHADPRFTERAADLGITHEYTGGWEHFVGGGVATFDCNGDHLPEIFAAGGTSPAILLLNHSTTETLNFAEATPEELLLTGVTGAYPLDMDSDGRTDLAILRVGDNLLLRGLPECRFEPLDLGFTSTDRWTASFSATWERGNALPTLAFGNYVDRTDPNGPFEACDANTLYRPQGQHYGTPETLTPGFCALSMLFSDWGRRGRADLRISNDRHYYVRGGSEQLWAMEAEPRLYTARDGWQNTAIWGMGIASRDISGDGIPEVFLTSMADQKLQILAADASGPSYTDAPYATGTTAQRPHTGQDGRPSTGWHAAFGDVDNDGRDDLFIAKGNVEAMPSNAIEDPNNLLMQQPDGTFAEVSVPAGVASMAKARGAALIDLNRDGWLDLVVMNRTAPLEIHQNQPQGAGNWLLVRVQQAAPNRNAVGAWIELRTAQGTQTREITVGGGHASGSLGEHHFGLGDAVAAQLRIIWPDGGHSDWHPAAPNTILTAHRIGTSGEANVTIHP